MNWPLPQDFNEAVQNPTTAFSDPDLKAGQAIVGPQGLPLPRSGNFADVYQVRAADGRDWAVKCFTRPVTGLEHRYAKVDAALDRAGLPFTIGFTFLNEGVRARGRWMPAVKMEWVDGLLLNQVVRDQAGNPKVLDALGQMWARLCKRLREAGIAHADLQHGNVLLVPGSRPGAYGLKLIDYDGMYVPALANNPSGEAGHPNYQHPTRATRQVYSPDLDRFPHLVIATALKGLAVAGAGLWDRYDTGDNLLFTDEDFRNPAGSRLMRELWQSNHPQLQALVGHLAVACGRPIPQTPWLDQIAPDGVAAPLAPEQYHAAAVALGFAAPPVAVVSPEEVGVELVAAPPPAPVAASPLDLPEFEVEREMRPRRRQRRSQPTTSPALIVGGVFLLLSMIAGAVVAGVVLLGGKSRDDTAQVQPKPEEPADREPRPKEKPTPVEKDREPPAPVVPKPPTTPVVPPQPPGPAGVAALPELPVRWEHATGFPTGVSRMAFTADGKLLAVAGYGRKEVRVYDANAGGQAGRFTEHESPVLGLASLPGGEIASLGADQGFAFVWDPRTGQGKSKILCPELPGRKPEPFLYTSPDGRFLLCGGTESDTGQPAAEPPRPIEVTDTETGKSVLSFQMSWGMARFTGDSSRLVVADDRTGQIRVFRLPSGQLESDARADEGGLVVAVSPTGRFVVFLGKSEQPGSRGYKVHDVATGRLVHTIQLPNGAWFRSGFSPDGKWLRLVQTSPTGGGTQVVLVNTATWAPVAVAPVGNAPGVQWDHGPQFSPDGKLLVVPKAAGWVVAFELPREGLALIPPKPRSPEPVVGEPVADQGVKLRWTKPSADERILKVAFAPDGQSLLVGTGTAGRVDVLDTRTGMPGATFQGHGPQARVSEVWGLERGRVASRAFPELSPLLWDGKTGTSLGTLVKPEWLPPAPAGMSPVSLSFAVSPDGRYVFAGYRGRHKPGVAGQPGQHEPAPFRVIDTSTGKEVLGGEWEVGTVRFAADSSRALIFESNGRFRWVGLPTGRVEAEWKCSPTGLPNPVTGVSADGSRVLFFGAELGKKGAGLHVLDGKTGQVLQTIPQYALYGNSVLSDDGLTVGGVGVVSRDGKLQTLVGLTDVRTGAVVRSTLLGTNPNNLRHFSFAPDLRSFVLLDTATQALSLYEFADGPAGVGPVAVGPKPKDPDQVVKPADPAPVNPGDGKVRWSVNLDDRPGYGGLAFARDGSAVAYGAGGSRVWSRDARTGDPLPAVQGHRIFNPQFLTPLEGDRFAVYSSGDNAFLIWHATTGRAAGKAVIPDIPGAENLHLARLSPNGKFLAAARSPAAKKDETNPKKTIFSAAPFRVFDVATGQAVVAFDGFAATAHFTADSARVLVAEWTGRYRWFRLPSGQPDGGFTLKDENPHPNAHQALRLSADGGIILYHGVYPGRGFGTYTLDAKNGQVLQSFGRIPFADMSPDGRLITTSWSNLPDDPGSIQVFSAVTGKAVARFPYRAVRDAGVVPYAISPDSRAVAVYHPTTGRMTVFDLPDTLVAASPMPKDPEPKPKDPEPRPKDPEPKPKDSDPKPRDPVSKPVERKPVPDDAALAQAQTRVREKHKADYARKSVAEKKAFAAGLIGLAEKLTDDPAGRYVMLRDARDIAVEAADPALAAQAVDDLGRSFEVEVGRLKFAALEKIREGSTSSATLRAVTEVALAGADDAMAADDYDSTVKLARLAAESARQGNLSSAIVDEAEAEVVLARKAGSAFEEVRPAVDRLKATPDDADAALAVGKFRCFTQGRWADGVKLLAKGGSPGLKAVAELDATSPREGGPAAKVGDAWWDHAQTLVGEEKRAAEARARSWYAAALPKLTGEPKAQAETRLRFSHNGIDYRPGLIAAFTAKVASVLQGKKARVDPVVSFSGGEFSDAGVGRATDISVKWAGVLVPPRAGRYRLVADATDPVRVRVDGKVVIDTITSKTARREGRISLPDRPCPVTIEFPCINTDRHHIKLCWACPGSVDEEMVPPEVLFHDPKAEGVIGK